MDALCWVNCGYNRSLSWPEMIDVAWAAEAHAHRTDLTLLGYFVHSTGQLFYSVLQLSVGLSMRALLLILT